MEGVAVRLEEYLSQYPNLLELYRKARKYLPSLPEEIYVVPFDAHIEKRVLAIAYEDKGKWYLAFRFNPPDEYTFLHELIHVAGGKEIEAYNYVSLLYYSIEKNLPEYNLLDFQNITLEEINEVLRGMGIKGVNSVEDYFNITGIIPVMFMDLDILPDGRKVFKVKEGVDPRDLAQHFLAEISSGIDYNPFDERIFRELVEKCLRRKRDQQSKSHQPSESEGGGSTRRGNKKSVYKARSAYKARPPSKVSFM